jgi:hypothetical protein
VALVDRAQLVEDLAVQEQVVVEPLDLDLELLGKLDELGFWVHRGHQRGQRGSIADRDRGVVPPLQHGDIAACSELESNDLIRCIAQTGATAFLEPLGPFARLARHPQQVGRHAPRLPVTGSTGTRDRARGHDEVRGVVEPAARANPVRTGDQLEQVRSVGPEGGRRHPTDA